MIGLQIDNEEYGEALVLARAYNLDCDRVYQRQWRKNPVSIASIQDYLVCCPFSLMQSLDKSNFSIIFNTNVLDDQLT